MATGAPLTIAQLLALHPFPAEHAKQKRIEKLWVFDLPGTARMTLVEKAGVGHGSSKAGGLRHEWLEAPWNWVAEQWLTPTRIYKRGFMKLMYPIHRLEPIETGTRVYLSFAAVPRNALY